MARKLLASLIIVWSVLPVSRALAQDEEPPLQLRLRRTFGYGGIGQIQGNFALRVETVEGLSRVEFLFDDAVVHTAQEDPFEFRFHTNDFPSGMHTMSAVGYTTDGQVLPSNSYTREFLTSEAAWSVTSGIMIPLLAGIGVLALASALIPFLLGRRQGHRPGQYGSAGGAVCPRCEKPYSRHFLSPNLIAGKLERCPHCGKWAIARRATPAELEAAEALLAGASTEEMPSLESQEEKLRRMIDDSRYE